MTFYDNFYAFISVNIGAIVFVYVFLLSMNVAASHVMINYNDSIVRRIIFPLTSASYGSTPKLCLKDLFNDGQLVAQYTVLCDRTKKYTCSGYLGYSPSAQTIFLIFRGSISPNQVKEEILETMLHFPKIFPLGGLVNPYFYNALTAILAAGLEQDLLNVSNIFPGFSLWVSGHSLGAGLAALAAGHAAYKGYVASKDIVLITFGQPRTGDYFFAKIIDRVIPNSWRVTHQYDLVPIIVPFYMHHNREIWYNNSMAPGEPYVICDDDDNLKCIRSGKKHNWDVGNLNFYNLFLLTPKLAIRVSRETTHLSSKINHAVVHRIKN